MKHMTLIIAIDLLCVPKLKISTSGIKTAVTAPLNTVNKD